MEIENTIHDREHIAAATAGSIKLSSTAQPLRISRARCIDRARQRPGGGLPATTSKMVGGPVYPSDETAGSPASAIAISSSGYS